jgi:hypothetical protein
VLDAVRKTLVDAMGLGADALEQYIRDIQSAAAFKEAKNV